MKVKWFFIVFFLLTVHNSQFTASSFAYTHDSSLIKWKEYTAEAFYEAQKEKKPIFLLITAVWCYWCHVYEEKTLETKEVADYINDNYIAVFVDHDRRRDIASKYSLGTPTTVFLSPNGEKIHAEPGYIEKERFLALLQNMAALASERFETTVEKEEKDIPRERKNISKNEMKTYLREFENHLTKNFDSRYGGFGEGRKMPFANVIDYMLDVYEFTRVKEWREMAVKTLDGIAGKHEKPKERWQSFEDLKNLRENKEQERWVTKIEQLQMADTIIGLFDEVEGGFFRYATQREWSYPHFEKMLEDQADLIRTYLHAFKITKDPLYKGVAERSLAYIIANLYDEKDGRFYGSQDADEVYYHFTLEERNKINKPKIDKTSYTYANANMIMTFLYAGDILKDPKYKNIALKGLAFFLKNMMTSHGVLNFYDPIKKKGFLDGQLEDNAWLSLALFEAYRSTKERRFLEQANSLMHFIIKNFYNKKDGGFIERESTSKEFYREKELTSTKRRFALNAIMGYTLIMAYDETKNKDYLEKAQESLGLFFFEEIDSADVVPFQKVARYLTKE